MKFSANVVAAIVAPMAAMAFMQPTLRTKVSTASAFNINSRIINEELSAQSKSMTELKMAFDLEDGQVSNMFEGPAPLVKERDACGVGFIANTQSGGKILDNREISSDGRKWSMLTLTLFELQRNLEHTKCFMRVS